ncbi:hypothetical protein THAOC_10082, partial [Thalassiosira oceanica]
MEDRSARSAWKVAPSRALGLGITERPPERPGKVRKVSVCRKFDSSLRQRVPFYRQNARRSCRADRTRRCLGMGRKVASRNRLVELYKSLSIDVFRDFQVSVNGARLRPAAVALDDSRKALVGREMKKKKSRRHARRLPVNVAGRCSDVKRPTRRAAAASRKTLGALQRRPEERRSSRRGRSRKKKDTRADAAAAGARVRWTASRRGGRSVSGTPPRSSIVVRGPTRRPGGPR